MAEDVFEELAKRYDTEDRVALSNIILDEIRGELRDSDSGSLLDYGCGTGLIGLELAGRFDSVTLADPSEQMIQVVDGKIERRKIRNAETHHLDGGGRDADLNADIIILSLVLLHVPDTQGLLRRLHGMLNESGRLFIVDFDKNERISHPKVHNGFTHEEMEENLSTAGFEMPEVRTFHHGTKIFMNEDASLFLASAKK